MSPFLRRAVFAAVVASAALAWSGCVAGGGAETARASPVPTEAKTAPSAPDASPSESDAQPARLGLVVVGDSNSTGFNGTLERGMKDGTAWAALLPPSQYDLVGGWAVDGATSEAMLRGLSTVPNLDTDALIVMAGTNDLAQGIPLSLVLRNVEQIIDRVSARCVVLSAIAPLDPLASDAMALNETFSDAAAEHGWVFVDAWTNARAADGTWRPALRTDGVHTSPAGYALAATAIGAALEEC